MNDYTIKIRKNGKIICALGGENMNYDNVLWLELSKLLSIVKKGFQNKNELLDIVASQTDYLKETYTFDDTDGVIDLDLQTIDIPQISFFKLDEVSQNDCFIELEKKNGKYYAIYEGGEKFPVFDLLLDEPKLLTERTLTFNDFEKLSYLIETLVNIGENDVVVNNNYLLRLSYI